VEVIFDVMDHPLQLIPRTLARLAGVKVLGSVHDATRHSGEESRVFDLLSRIAIRASDGILTYSDAVAEQLATRGTSVVPRVFKTVHGAFGIPVVPRKHPGIDGSDFVVGFFGRIERYKGLSRLLAAAAVLRRNGFPVIVKIHGRGALTESERQLASNVRAEVYSGWVAESEIQETVASYDLLALPYDDASQSGVLGYALSAGVPSVCTPVGGLSEQVIQSRAGLVADGMSAESFAAAIEAVLGDADRYAALSAAGVHSATTAFSWGRVAEDVLSAARKVSAAST
jgi:glycosyltransferase involved in cell wall biosynthesis